MSTSANQLAKFIERNHPLVVVTGAGCSEASGIPTYRDDNGTWLRSNPIQHQEFLSRQDKRQRYWTRSFSGWPFVASAQPNATHNSLVELEKLGLLKLLVTQNVDRLHQRSGHQNVIDLHGRLDHVHCLECYMVFERSEIQSVLAELNPHLIAETKTSAALHVKAPAPDGDADVADNLAEQTVIPHCSRCNGMLKPSVVFYGGGVDKTVGHNIYEQLQHSDGLLTIGTSLMVFSSFRFCRYAATNGKPIAIVNAGKTRADELATLKLTDDCEALLPAAVKILRG